MRQKENSDDKVYVGCRICRRTGVNLFNFVHTDTCLDYGHCLGIPYCPVQEIIDCKYCSGTGYITYDYKYVTGHAICEYQGPDYIPKSFGIRDTKEKIREYLSRHLVNGKYRFKVSHSLSRKNKTIKIILRFVSPSKEMYYVTLRDCLLNCGVDLDEFKIKDVKFRIIVGMY